MPSQNLYYVTPWRTTQDLLGVRRALYTPSTPADRASAIAKVQAWKLRGNLPHAVESTALLFAALSAHSSAAQASKASGNPAASHGSDFVVRATYTLALSRFVTGFADLGRHRSGPGQSMFDVARSINLPPHFVELRHEAAHEEMPSLTRLVRSAEEALGWLWNVYWAGLEAGQGAAVDGDGAQGNGDDGLDDFGLRAELRTVLKAFRSRRVAALKAGKRRDKQAKQDVQDACSQCEQLCVGKEVSWNSLATVLIEERYLVPSERELSAPMEGAYLLWDDMLQGLAEDSLFLPHHFIPQAVACMSTTSADIDPSSDPGKEALFEWLAHVLTASSWQTIPVMRSSLCDQVALEECSIHPGYWSRKLGKLLLEQVDEDVREKYQPVMQASVLMEASADESEVNMADV